MVQRILRINRDTIFKLRAEPATQLQPNERFSVKAGATYEIQSYAYANADGDFNGHIKFALAKQSIQGFNTWFIHSADAQVEFDGVVVYPHEDQESRPVLNIAVGTLLKRRPLQSSALPPSEVAPVSKGQRFTLQSYAYSDAAGDFSDHIKFAILNESDFVQGLSTWFVYKYHAFVEFDGDVVYPKIEPSDFVVRITQNTLFKRRPVQSSQLAPNERFAVERGSSWIIQGYAYADASGPFNGHIRFALKYPKDEINGFNTWYVYDQHAQVEVNSRVVYPTNSPPPPPPPPTFPGNRFTVPGVGTVASGQPIISGGNFTWGEATKDGSRIPANATIARDIITLARELQKARNQIGRPFRINSWYRPPDVNASVGGASRSQHLYGKAADIQVSGLSGRAVANAVFPWWNGGIGIYSNMPNVVHLDIGPRRYWGF
ncbi:YcbK family protein [Leptolyngbya sp. AN02str]|uniref:YcbK family protein n=1 Tax=Leptolyngbya sp. AN02str TaxID=3423363 RepID=UPI003D31AC7A